MLAQRRKKGERSMPDGGSGNRKIIKKNVRRKERDKLTARKNQLLTFRNHGGKKKSAPHRPPPIPDKITKEPPACGQLQRARYY